MRAVGCKVHGMPESLVVADIASPVPGAGKVLVQMRVPQDKLLSRPERMPYEVAASALTALMQGKADGKLAILP